jgi:hypothetical protein
MRSGGKGTGGTGGTGDTVGGEGGGRGTDTNGSSSLKSVQISASSPQRGGGGGGGGLDGHRPSKPVLGSDSHNSFFGQTHNSSTTTCHSAPASPTGPCIYLPLSLFRPPSGWTGGGRREKSFGQGVCTRERAHGELLTDLERDALKNAARSTHTHTHTRVCVYTHTHVCVYTHTHTHTHKDTHTHTCYMGRNALVLPSSSLSRVSWCL